MAAAQELNPKRDYPDLIEDQMLAIAIYGETVAAYRYMVLSEKLPNEEDRKMFAAISDEEQTHKQQLQTLADKHYPDSSFFISDADKALVVAGPRLIDVRDIQDYRSVMGMALETEWLVARFYQAMSTRARTSEIRDTFTTLGNESFTHYRRLQKLARERGLLSDDD